MSGGDARSPSAANARPANNRMTPDARIDHAIDRLIGLVDDPVSPVQVLLAPKVRQMFGGISETTLWRWVKTEGFPAPFKVSGGTNGWYLHELLAYLQRKARERRQ
ncbi:MAG: helix-turn-helix transcriptional regulator [Geminicoccaceae bacterium]